MQEQELSGVRAVVTGATSGIGAAIAIALMRAGAAVAIAARPTPRLTEVTALHRASGLEAEPLPVDVRDPESVEEAAAAAYARLGEIDLVVNNAGIGMRTVNPRFLTQPQPFFDVGPAGFTDVIATNLTGYFLVARAFARRFAQQRHGRFINVSMSHETMRRAGFVPYGPSRAGAESLSLIMTEDLRPFGIGVNILLPGGATATGMIPDGMPADVVARLLPAEIMGPPAVFLASKHADGLTGERIVAAEFDRWLADFRSRRRAASRQARDGS
ncbi:MAG: SDR family NAD(P)-dependent oxidoreductase [Streptosporangiaceae bacterium]